MNDVLLAPLKTEASSLRLELRTPEWVGVSYFCYTTILCIALRQAPGRIAWAACIPFIFWIVAAIERTYSRAWLRVTRSLVPVGLILVAYRQLDWFRRAPSDKLQQTWMQWDRFLLSGLGLRAGIETFGRLLPVILETAYLLLYAIPPLCVLLLIRYGYGSRVDRFLLTLLLGTFAAYALLPYFPSVPPRIAFPRELLPTFNTPVRWLNLYVLDHMDISTSVFPSGHIAVAASSALGLWSALPERRWPAIAGGVMFCLIFIATVYGRYHYATDGIASLVICLGMWRLGKLIE